MDFFNKSTKLFTFQGIPLIIMPNFKLYLLIISLLFFITGCVTESAKSGLIGAIVFVSIILYIFSFVVLHEFGHSLTAKYYGMDVEGIYINFFGGLAVFNPKTFNLKHEFWISINGPLVNVFFIFLFYPLQDLHVIFYFSYMINYVLLFFNMAPCYPMDGGRIFRSIVYYFNRDLIASTKIACYTCFVMASVVFLLFLFKLQIIGCVVMVAIMFFAKMELETAKSWSVVPPLYHEINLDPNDTNSYLKYIEKIVAYYFPPMSPSYFFHSIPKEKFHLLSSIIFSPSENIRKINVDIFKKEFGYD